MKTSKKLKNPAFTVVTVTLDNLDGLKKTFESIKTQSSLNFEWLIISGKSQDETESYLRATKKDRSNLFTIRYLCEPDEGIYDAMNKGIKHAYGDYIIFMNAGDEFASEKTLEEIEQHTEKQPEFIYGDALEPSNTGKKHIKKPARRYKDLPQGMFTHHQAMLYSSAHIKKHDLRYSMLYDISADYDFTIRFLQSAKKIAYIPAPICIFEQGGISQQQALKGRREQFIIREKLEIVSLYENVKIFIIQTLSWELKNRAPWLYNSLKNVLIRKQ